MPKGKISYRQIIKPPKCLIGGKPCKFDSREEMYFAAYLQIRKQRGEIIDWHYEGRKAANRWQPVWIPFSVGPNNKVKGTYIDFWIDENDGKKSVVEFKGRMDSKSRIKHQNLMKIYGEHGRYKLVMQNSAFWQTIKALHFETIKKKILFIES